MHLKLFSKTLCLLLFIFSCAENASIKKNTLKKAVCHKNYEFDFKLINNLETPVQIIENETVLSFKSGNRINLYDMESGNLIDSIIVRNIDPNKIHHIFLLDSNKLAVFYKYNNQIMLVDRDFNTLLTREFPGYYISKDSIVNYLLDRSVSVRPDILTNGLVGCKVIPYFNFDVSVPEYFSFLKKYNIYSNAIISFEPFNIKMLGSYPQNYYENIRLWNGLEYSSTLRIIDSLTCIQCLRFENTCYLYHLKDNKITQLNFQSNFTSMPPKPPSMFPSYDKSEYADAIQMYANLFVNQKTKKIYRIVQHEMPIKDEKGNYNMHGENNWSIIEYDLNSKQFNEYFFEQKHYDFNNILPFKDGLLISNKAIKNKYYDPAKQSYSYFTFE